MLGVRSTADQCRHGKNRPTNPKHEKRSRAQPREVRCPHKPAAPLLIALWEADMRSRAISRQDLNRFFISFRGIDLGREQARRCHEGRRAAPERLCSTTLPTTARASFLLLTRPHLRRAKCLGACRGSCCRTFGCTLPATPSKGRTGSRPRLSWRPPGSPEGMCRAQRVGRCR